MHQLEKMPCCKCNRTGRCRNCACVKAGRPCLSCLPARLGQCTNSIISNTPVPSTQSGSQPPIVSSVSQSTATSQPMFTASADPQPLSTYGTSQPTGSQQPLADQLPPSQLPIQLKATTHQPLDTVADSHLQIQPTLTIPDPTRTSPPVSTQDQVIQQASRSGGLQSSTYEPTTTLTPPTLPEFTPMSSPTFVWGVHDSATIIASINSAYEEVVHWRKNICTIWEGWNQVCY